MSESSTETFDFKHLNLSIPNIVYTYPIEKQREIYEYLSQLNEIERKAYEIAYDHLELSFNVARSNGFKKWLQKNK